MYRWFSELPVWGRVGPDSESISADKEDILSSRRSTSEEEEEVERQEDSNVAEKTDAKVTHGSAGDATVICVSADATCHRHHVTLPKKMVTASPEEPKPNFLADRDADAHGDSGGLPTTMTTSSLHLEVCDETDCKDWRRAIVRGVARWAGDREGLRGEFRPRLPDSEGRFLQVGDAAVEARTAGKRSPSALRFEFVSKFCQNFWHIFFLQN
jgi:hypothetical protein